MGHKFSLKKMQRVLKILPSAAVQSPNTYLKEDQFCLKEKNANLVKRGI